MRIQPSLIEGAGAGSPIRPICIGGDDYIGGGSSNIGGGSSSKEFDGPHVAITQEGTGV